jgi:hypothetical protein
MPKVQPPVIQSGPQKAITTNCGQADVMGDGNKGSPYPMTGVIGVGG